MSTILVTQTIEALNCGACRVLFGMERSQHADLQRTGDWFWCPNGHKIHYGENETQRLRDQLAREKHEAEQARADATYQRERRQQADRSAAAQRGLVTKIKKRVAHGVCPCCKRTFQDLARHMAGQHPTFAESSR